MLLPATLAQRLGIQQTADALIDLGERAGAAHPGRKLLTLVHSMLAGGDCIDDADVLRCGQTAAVGGHRVMAPSTLGTFLRSSTFGHVRQLDRLTEQLLGRAWVAGAGPGDGPMTCDLDSTVCPVHGHAKQGAAYGDTHTLPRGSSTPTPAWLLAATLAHNLPRWVAAIGLGAPHRAGGGQDAAPHPAGPARPHHPLRPTMDAAPARRLALGGVV